MKFKALFVVLSLYTASAGASCHDLLEFSATKLRSNESIDFCESFKGKALLVVNTASQCGHTPQFAGLEKLHKKYSKKLAIVGFPSNAFNQEHADTKKVADVCYVNYGVTFTMLEPSEVKGEGANDMFKKLKKLTGKEPAWNFNKFLVSPDGSQVAHFASSVQPDSDELLSKLNKMIE